MKETTNLGFVRKVEALLSENNVAREAGPMLCGLSGGADSVALVLVLQELGYKVVGLHCNFQLRGQESERDEQFVQHFCAEHDIPLHTTRFDTCAEAKAEGESIEMAARRLRYDWFAEVASRIGAKAADRAARRGKPAEVPRICVAHHADDNVETMLLNLIRGAGLHGLTGMDFENDWGVLRPLLGVTRAEIIGYLKARGQAYVTDSTNTDTHYRRNKVRHELLPLLREMNPSIDRTLTQTMFRLRQAEDILSHHDNGEDYRRRQQLQDYGFTMTQILQMEQARGGAFVTTTHCPHCPGEAVMLTKHRGEYVVGRVPQTIPPTPLRQGYTYLDGLNTNFEPLRYFLLTRRQKPDAVVSLKNKRQGVLDVSTLRGRLYVRSVSEGDRFTPYGMQGTKLVSDYLTDRKRSRLDKLAALVVCDDAGIVWLVGETIDQRAAVTPATSETVVIKFDYEYIEP